MDRQKNNPTQALPPVLVSAVNLVTGRQVLFRDRVAPEFAVAWGYYLSNICLEDLVEQVGMGIDPWTHRLIYSPRGVMMGDWFSRLEPGGRLYDRHPGNQELF